ncbi:hypothetical protein [Candidatus Finniella inopinata]|uniref:Right-handed parallel beta-helix repeat-containing protein n=1 Tax=Candidatus Finniella inopinata TaxID=1696036 RepID=A0A4Q7DKG9_9PROT|nr:hypothetical protein [Candidatus Finniella inopinata]RZI46878.1 hypothetical protein EQU50_01250 [Candidatus Finniella inopinata]
MYLSCFSPKSYAYLYISMGLLSPACAAVQLDGNHSFDTIHDALRTVPHGKHTVTLSNDIQQEASYANLSNCSSLTVKGKPSGGTTIKPSLSASMGLFNHPCSHAMSLTLSDVTIKGFNTCSYILGGAITADALTLIGNGSVTFKNNRTTAGNGGGILACSLDLTDVHFTENKSTYSGGAIYVCGPFTYTTNSLTRFDPSVFPPKLGDNDIACLSILSMRTYFTKNGQGSLVLNTNNSEWTGNAFIQEGAFIIGETETNTHAIWGSLVGNLTVQRGATVGGFGTIKADSLIFEAGSIWRLFFSSDKAGNLNVWDTLTLPTGVEVNENSLAHIVPADGFIIATYRRLSGDLAPLNAQLAIYGLFLENQITSPSKGSLVLKKPPVYNIAVVQKSGGSRRE